MQEPFTGPQSPPGRRQSLPVRLAQSLFQLREEEVGRVGLMFLYSLMAVGAFILGRMIRDTLLLSLPKAQGINLLPTLMALSAVAVSIVAYLYSRVANRLRRDQMIIVINTILAVVLTLIYVALLFARTAGTRAMLLQWNYMFVEVMGSLQVIQFWTLASELFNPREAKRSFAIIGGGAVLANLLAFAIRPLVKVLPGVHHLLPLLVGMLVLCVIVVFMVGRQNKDKLNELRQQKAKHASKKSKRRGIAVSADSERIWSNSHLFVIAMMIFVTFLTTTIIDYQFKAVAESSFPGEVQKIEYFSLFYGLTGILCCIMQFVIASRLLQRAGIRIALLLLPMALFSGSMLFAVAPLLISVFWAATITKGSENVLRYTIYEVSLNLLYVPVSAQIRARAKTFIDGILKPAAIGAAAALIALFKLFSRAEWNPPSLSISNGESLTHLGGLTQRAQELAGQATQLLSPQSDFPAAAQGFVLKVQHLSLFSAALLLVWIALILRAHREYVSTLVNSMQKSRLDIGGGQFSMQDEETIKVLRGELSSADPDRVLLALDMLSRLPARVWFKEVEALLSLPNDEVRVACLQMLAQAKDKQAAVWVEEFLDHAHPKTRAQAIETFCALRGEHAIEAVVPHLEDPDIEVCSASIVGLIRHGGLDGILHAAVHLKQLLEHDAPKMRNAGARILGRLEVRNFYQPIQRLLKDKNPIVQASAIDAASVLQAPQLVPHLIALLPEMRNGKHTVRALIAYGEAIWPALKNAFLRYGSEHVRVRLIRVMAHLENQDVIDLFSVEILSAAPKARLAMLESLRRIYNSDPSLRTHSELFRKLLEQEFRDLYLWVVEREVLQKELGTSATVLVEALHERVQRGVKIIFAILALLYPPREIQLIYVQLEEGSIHRRANALELLDTMLGNEASQPLLPILEQKPNLIPLAHELYGITRPSWRDVLERVGGLPSPWLQACVLWTIAQAELRDMQAFVVIRGNHEDMLVREAAWHAMELFVPKGMALNETLAGVSLAGGLTTHHEEAGNMLSTIEKLLFLKRISLFERLSSEDLVRLTQIAEEVHLEQDELLMKEGDLGDALFIVIEGQVEISKGPIVLAVLGEKEPIGEMGILDSAPRSATVRAMTDLRLLKIEREAFHELMAERLEIAQGVIHVLLGRLRRLSTASAQESLVELPAADGSVEPA